MNNDYTAVLKYFALVKQHISDSAKFARHSNAWLDHDATNLVSKAVTGHFFDDKLLNIPQKIITIHREIDSLNFIYLDQLQAFYGALHTVMRVMKATLPDDQT